MYKRTFLVSGKGAALQQPLKDLFADMAEVEICEAFEQGARVNIKVPVSQTGEVVSRAEAQGYAIRLRLCSMPMF